MRRLIQILVLLALAVIFVWYSLPADWPVMSNAGGREEATTLQSAWRGERPVVCSFATPAIPDGTLHSAGGHVRIDGVTDAGVTRHLIVTDSSGWMWRDDGQEGTRFTPQAMSASGTMSAGGRLFRAAPLEPAELVAAVQTSGPRCVSTPQISDAIFQPPPYIDLRPLKAKSSGT